MTLRSILHQMIAKHFYNNFKRVKKKKPKTIQYITQLASQLYVHLMLQVLYWRKHKRNRYFNLCETTDIVSLSLRLVLGKRFCLLSNENPDRIVPPQEKVCICKLQLVEMQASLLSY